MKPIGLLFKTYPQMRSWIQNYKFQFNSVNQRDNTAFKNEQMYILMWAYDTEHIMKYVGIEFQDIIAIDCDPEIYEQLRYRIRPHRVPVEAR